MQEQQTVISPTECLSRQEYYKQYRQHNHERLLNHDKERNKLPKRIAQRRTNGKEYYKKNKETVLARVRAYRKLHPDQSKAFIAAWRASLFEIWGVSQTQLSQLECRQLGLKAQTLAISILEGLGYTVLPIADMLPLFPIDIMAKKDGRLYGIEVSVYPRKKFRPPLIQLIHFINAELLCLFIRPSLTDYCLIHADGRHCVSVPKKIVVEEGITIVSN